MPKPMLKRCVLLLVVVTGCSSQTTVLHEKLNKSIVARYGNGSRLMRGHDSESQSIIDRYCLAESKDRDDDELDPRDPYQSGWRPWLCGPIPATYLMAQMHDGTYHVRYKQSNLDATGKPKDVWKHEGVRNVELDEFVDELKKHR